MVYFVITATVIFVFSAMMTAACYFDAKNIGRKEDIFGLRVSLVALIASPLAGLWLPFALLGLAGYGLHRAYRLAFLTERN